MIHEIDTGKRTGAQAIKQIFLNRTGCALVKGFERIASLGDASANEQRTAGFMESHAASEYAISLNAKTPLSFFSEPVNPGGAKKTAFWLSAGFGNGSPLPQPGGKFNIYVNDVFCLAVRNVNYSFYWRGENGEFAFSMRRCETAPPYTGMQLSTLIKDEAQAAFGIGLLVVDSGILTDGQPAKITVEPAGEYKSSKYFYLSRVGDAVYQANIWSAFDVLKTKNIKKSNGHSVYFGDIHTHSGQTRENADNRGCGMGSMEDNYRYAKGPGGLHFYALTDHEWQVLPDYEATYFGLADLYNKDGEFACIKAFEHTSVTYGHRNIYFKDKAKVIDAANGRPNPTHPAAMFETLKAGGYEFFSIPHHPSSSSHPFNTGLLFDEDICAEVYSVWGSSEYWGDFPRGVSDRHDCYWVSDIFKTDKIMGIVASSDGHDGHPGNEQSPYPKHQHQFHFCGSGLTAALCESLTRENVYEAIKNRRCYATTGAPILLEVGCGGCDMGSVLTNQKSPPVFDIKCKGTNSLCEIRIVKNGSIAHVHPCCGAFEADFTYVDRDYGGRDANYYIRVVQSDMESAWCSPFFFRQAR